MGLVLLGSVALEMVRNKTFTLSQATRYLMAAFVTAWMVFVLVNPFTWLNPPVNSFLFFQHLIDTTKAVEAKYSINYLGDVFKRYPTIMGTLIQRQETGLIRFIKSGIVYLFTYISLIFSIIKITWKKSNLGQATVNLMFLGLGIITYTYLSIDWWRYYLPLMISMSFVLSQFTTAGFYFLTIHIKKIINQ